jgi:hypothetical protein
LGFKKEMTALVWKDGRDIHMLTNLHIPPAEGSFCDKHENAIKPAIVEEYNRHMGLADKSERMATGTSVVRAGNQRNCSSIYRI